MSARHVGAGAQWRAAWCSSCWCCWRACCGSREVCDGRRESRLRSRSRRARRVRRVQRRGGARGLVREPDAMSDMRSTDEVIEDALYAELMALLARCTEVE